MANFDLTMPEVWYPVPEFPGYEVSSHFRVRSFHRKGGRGGFSCRARLLAVYPLKSGYLVFHVRRGGKAFTLYLHHVVANLAMGPCPDGLEILHADDDKRNNAPANLSYGTTTQNAIDAFRNGKRARGEDRTQAKLTDEAIARIRAMLKAGVVQRSIAREFGIDQSLVSRIKSGRRWVHVV